MMGLGQGFINLDFEDARVAPWLLGEQAYLDKNDVLPGWAYYPRNLDDNGVFFNTMSAGGGMVSVVDSTFRESSFAIEGRFSVKLNTTIPNGIFQSAWIAQSGHIPEDARSIVFSTRGYGPVDSPSLRITFNGTELPYYFRRREGEVSIFRADISNFSGSDGELKFAVIPRLDQSPKFSSNLQAIDGIRFSALVAPEPSTYALVIAGTSIWILCQLFASSWVTGKSCRLLSFRVRN